MNANRGLLAGPLIALVTSAGGCEMNLSRTELASSPDILAKRVEKAHGITAWRNIEVIACDITVYFGGQKALEGSMEFAPHANLSRIETADGTIMVFDGQRAWISPAEATSPMTRFHLLTWPYFIAAPFKLLDSGTHRASEPPATYDGEQHYRFTLSFGQGVGDSPDDWYIVYVHGVSDRLSGMAYIVTYGTTQTEAEKEPHAIAYHDYEWIGDVLLSTRWTFHGWSEDNGYGPDTIGHAELSNLRQIPTDPMSFIPPADAREESVPGMTPGDGG